MSIIERAVRNAGFDGDVVACQPLSGGCIFSAQRADLSDGSAVVAKCGGGAARSQFEEEVAGLRALAQTHTVTVPQPLGVFSEPDESVLLMSYIEPGKATSAAWAGLGADLAALHSTDVGERYGFDLDNHLGSTRQVNTWCDDWVEFNRVHRFGFQLDLAVSRGLIAGSDAAAVRQLINRLETLIPRTPRPSLLHGDLWSGNALPTAAGRVAVIDPAPYIGDGWADVAMMQLFGGFPDGCYDAYRSSVEDCDNADTRIAVYQLYHLMNHINIFGRGYVGQTMSMVKRLL